MRRKDINKLEHPYPSDGAPADHRFYTALGADIPHARILSKQILSQLDDVDFGLTTLIGVSVHERILISDYLYQCLSSIEMNLSEAKIHFLEWLDSVEKQS